MKVKVLLVMRRHGMPLPLDESEIGTLVGGMQGEADENIAAAVIGRHGPMRNLHEMTQRAIST
jgi:hypothetical protein